MQNTEDYENAEDAAIINLGFQKFLKEYTDANGTYLPEVTDKVLEDFGVKDRKSYIAVMVYAFTAGMNMGIGLCSEDETEK